MDSRLSPMNGDLVPPEAFQMPKRGMSLLIPDGQYSAAQVNETRVSGALARGYRQMKRERQKEVGMVSPLSGDVSPMEGGPSPPMAPGAPSGSAMPRVALDEAYMRKQRGQLHLQSADLFDNFSPVQKERQLWEPTLPDAFTGGVTCLEELDPLSQGLVQHDEEALKALHPKTFGLPYLDITAGPSSASDDASEARPLRVGLVLSGGPAPGGHNVIAGVYDYIKKKHLRSELYGFLGGLDGLFQTKYRLVTDEMMGRFRNQGGFDMLWSGRGRVNGSEDLHLAAKVCRSLELHGLIIIGGDGSNSNAALLAEYFAENFRECAVIGVPKTIDGDLRNPCIETSFGFDTAAKTYSELIGNLCTDVTSSKRVYHFVRVMGRSASHLVLECALQTRPNLVYIGEEVEALKVSLRDIVEEIVELIVTRRNQGKSYGVILVPEGLIEFIPEMNVLIDELNVLLSQHRFVRLETSAYAAGPKEEEFNSGLLSVESQKIWDFLPDQIRDQLLMDREATGYIQVAKIATERLLIMLTEAALTKRNIDINSVNFMPHYFGYEGRCAMPSNFDANYCYALGNTAGCLIQHRKNGYMAVVRRLDQHVTLWQPAGLPFTRIMSVKTASDGSTFPGVIRQLVDLNGPLFKVLSEARDVWKYDDVYRVPGPIQFEGPVADVADYTVSVPTAAELIHGSPESEAIIGSAIAGLDVQEDEAAGSIPHPKVLSELQIRRLSYIPDIPPICTDPKARAVAGVQHLPKDPYTQRQTLAYYPYLCQKNHFQLCEVHHDRYTPPLGPGVRIGVIFLSRQSPGCLNILWGLYERLKIVRGTCVGFKGLDSLLRGECITLTSEVFRLYCNQGGVALLGRSVSHTLFDPENQAKAAAACEKLHLDGLVVIGSSLAMTEATLLSEYFIAHECRTLVVGIPATSSGDVMNELIETNVGFDTSSKVYANLIGNVLTEAASMPKYWHFVRLMGRSPSNEVLECALQTHPSFVIIAEEYGAAGKTLADVVNDIADVVCRRAEMGKNFGTVLIPDGLLTHLPSMKNLMKEVMTAIKIAQKEGTLLEFQDKMINLNLDGVGIGGGGSSNATPDGGVAKQHKWAGHLTPWSMALFRTLPKFIRRDLVQLEMGEMRFTVVESELLLAEMVKKEVAKRKKAKRYSGNFAAVTHFFGYQGRSSMPSSFDAKLGFAYGHLGAIIIESGLTGHACTIRGLVGSPEDWKLGAIPFNSLLAVIPAQQDVHPDLQKSGSRHLPVIPSSQVDPNCKAYRWMKTAVEQWQMQDRFCNPGPVQFDGSAASFYNRILHEEQAEYCQMLRHVRMFTSVLKDTCSFGVDEQYLKVAFTNLHSLLTLRFHPDDLLGASLPRLHVDVDEYERAQGHQGHRPSVWESEGAPPPKPSSLAPSSYLTLRRDQVPGVRRFASAAVTDIARRKSSVDSGAVRFPSVAHESGWGASEVGSEAYPVR